MLFAFLLLYFLNLINDYEKYGILKLEVHSNRESSDRVRKCLGKELGFRVIKKITN